MSAMPVSGHSARMSTTGTWLNLRRRVDWPGRYAPPRVSGQEKTVIAGDPDQRHISTSLVERQNLTMRRFTRLTNAFSKKFENVHAAVALHFARYNLCAYIRPCA
jgi:hypothetical protein